MQNGGVLLKNGCMSCNILSGRTPSPGGVIYENEAWHVDSIQPPVVWKGFLIVKLKRHCEHIAELTPQESLSLGPTLQQTCRALSDVLNPAKIYVCSFGDGVKHIHFWVLPRPPEMRPGMHTVMRHLDMRTALTRFLGLKKWIVPEAEIEQLVVKLKNHPAFQ
jgi:diadenosine tetraphosphate (Ap4A) HIT family hydrolase